MSIFPVTNNPKSALQSRLFQLASASLFILSAILTLSPAVKFRSWQVDYRWSHWTAFIIWMIGAILIHRTTLKKFTEWDAIILPTAFLLVGWGILTIWRLNFIFGIRQTLWYALSVAMIYFLFKQNSFLDTLRKFKYFLLILGLSLALLTFFFGTYPGGEGPNLWLGMHGIYFQPSEILKIILIIYLAAFFSERYFLKFNLLETILPALILVLAALFILVGQRDMGTALIFIVIYIGMLYIAFGKKRILLIGGGIIALAAVVGYVFIDLIRIRFQAWVLPWLDPQSGSYQIIQSVIAQAAGGVFGSGLGIGYPNLVPISHSDFIYASIVEETGLVGSIALISLFMLLLYRGIFTALKTDNKYHRFLATGVTIYLIFQTILIIGGNIRLLPITGVTLPFVSYGGSSLITSMLAIFIIIKISDCKFEIQRDMKRLAPFRNGTILFSAGLVLLAIITGWWTVIRSNDLQIRQDNSRNLIASSYVKRGSILDRNGEEITATDGSPGSYSHQIQYAPLSNTIGYYDHKYGFSGLESTYNDYLSGQRGYPAFKIWFNYLLYDQPLPGRDIKLTLDLKTQEIVDSILDGHQGAALVMNADNGEILAMSSFPHYDANSLDENWENWSNDENAPFLNRTVQGAYPLGELFSTFLIAEDESLLEIDLSEAGTSIDRSCAIGTYQEAMTWSQFLTRGCSIALQTAVEERSGTYILNTLSKYGLDTVLDVGLPVNEPQELDDAQTWQELLYGSNQVRVSPLQVAYAAGIFSNEGERVTPHILTAIDTQQEGWVNLGEAEEYQVISAETAEDISRLLSSEQISGWELSSQSVDENGVYSWYVAGTPAKWNGTPLIVVVVLENTNAEDPRSLGRQIFRSLTES